MSIKKRVTYINDDELRKGVADALDRRTRVAKDMDDNDVVKGDVVQIAPEVRLFDCAFGVVTEAAGWGICVDVYNAHKIVYPARLVSNQFVKVGRAKWLIGDL